MVPLPGIPLLLPATREWLLDSDPAIRWQVLGDLAGAPAFTRFAFPTWWHYDVLRGLEFLRRAGVAPEARLGEAIDLVLSKRGADGRWLLEARYPGEMPVELGEAVGQPSRWITLRALRVLTWYAGHGFSPMPYGQLRATTDHGCATLFSTA